MWLDALRRVCAAHEILSFNFPTDTMSQSALEHAATLPFRFAAYLKREHETDDAIPALSTRLLTLRLPKSSKYATVHSGAIHQVRLVPGGRFLVVSTTTGLLHLWDLGYNAEAIHPFPLTSVSVRGPSSIHIQPTPDGQGFRLVSILDVIK